MDDFNLYNHCTQTSSAINFSNNQYSIATKRMSPNLFVNEIRAIKHVIEPKIHKSIISLETARLNIWCHPNMTKSFKHMISNLQYNLNFHDITSTMQLTTTTAINHLIRNSTFKHLMSSKYDEKFQTHDIKPAVQFKFPWHHQYNAANNYKWLYAIKLPLVKQSTTHGYIYTETCHTVIHWCFYVIPAQYQIYYIIELTVPSNLFYKLLM